MTLQTIDLFVPGRICLFGEHSDWAGGYRRINSEIEKGYTIITGTNQGLYATAKAHDSKIIYHTTLRDKKETLELPADPAVLLEEARKGGFWSYIAGVAFQILTHYHVNGIEIDNYKTDLPVKKGLSSSAATCVLTARAFNRIYDLRMTVRGEMDFAYRGEITTPSRCGRMDQGCAYGNKPILMTFDGDAIDVDEFSVKNDLFFVIADLGAKKDTVKILKDLNKAYPFADNQVQENVHTYLGPINSDIVRRALEAINDGNAEEVGALMTEAQDQFDRHLAPACPEELTAPVLHKVLRHPSLAPHIWGGKGVGSQGDGTVQFIAKDEAAQQKAREVLETELGLSTLSLTIRKTRKITKAVITAAGSGTRLFPMTKLVRKEFLPVLDKEGTLKPLILQNIEEAVNAGAEEIFLIIRRSEQDLFEHFFKEPVPVEVYNRLTREKQQYSSYLEEVGSRITFVYQDEQLGLAHALFQTGPLVGDQPFLFILGDHYFTSADDKSCTEQLLDAYEKYEHSIIGLHITPESEIHRFGCVTGTWDSDEEVLSITEFKEKPSPEYAGLHLKTDTVPNGHYLTIFGQYILSPRIFSIIDEMVRENYREQNEFQLTTALDRLRREEPFEGVVINGRRIDIGTPDGFKTAVRGDGS